MKPIRSLSIILGIVLFGLTSLILLFLAAPGQAETTAFSFKDQDGVPITGIVRVLCFDGITAVSPFADLNIQVNAGTPTAPLPAHCTHLAALRLRHTQPSGKHDEPAYWIYTTSWTPGETQPLAASGDIILSDLRPLTLINMIVSLGWTPAPNSPVATPADIRAAMQALSQDLYDWTEGQMALGPVSINTGGTRWAEADLRFLPANDKRPSAFVGGIVADKVTYTGAYTDTTYTPAAAYFGRLWDGGDAFDEGNGRWTNPNASRTIGHEWGHYALFLYDEYQDTLGNSGYCICNTLSTTGCRTTVPDASVMAYHYSQAAEFWHKDTHLTVSPFCYETWQRHVHGGTDWDTLSQWQEIQALPLPAGFYPLRPPSSTLTLGPELGLTAYLFGAQPGREVFLPLVVRDGETAVSPQEPIINLHINATSPPTATIPTQVYLLQGGRDNPNRILPQGRATGNPIGSILGSLRLLDVAAGDDVRAYADRPGLDSAPGTRYTLFADADPASDITVSPNPWQFVLDHHFTLVENRVMTLTLALTDLSGTMSLPEIQLCSLDAAIGCHPAWNRAMTASGSGSWQAQFAPLPGQKELPRYLVVRIVDAADNAASTDLVQWLQVGGGVGPTHKDGMAPLLDDVVMVNVAQPLANAGDCNVVSYMPAANTDAAKAPLPAGFGGLVGIPLDIDITLTTDLCPKWTPGQDQSFPPNLTVLLNFGYSQDEVSRLSLVENADLFLLHYDQGSGWGIAQQNIVNTDLNWIASMIFEDGIYAIGWRP